MKRMFATLMCLIAVWGFIAPAAAQDLDVYTLADLQQALDNPGAYETVQLRADVTVDVYLDIVSLNIASEDGHSLLIQKGATLQDSCVGNGASVILEGNCVVKLIDSTMHCAGLDISDDDPSRELDLAYANVSIPYDNTLHVEGLYALSDSEKTAYHYYYDIDQQKCTNYTFYTNYVIDNEHGTIARDYVWETSSFKRIGHEVVPIEMLYRISDEWVDELTGDYGSYVYDPENDLVTDIVSRDNDCYKRKEIYYLSTNQTVYYEIYQYDDEGNVTDFTIHSDYVYDLEAGTFTYHYAYSNGMEGTLVNRIEDGVSLSNVWTNKVTGDHGSYVEDDETGLATSINYTNNDHSFVKFIYDSASNRLVYMEHNQYDDEGNTIYWVIYSDYVYNDEEGTYTRHYSDSNGVTKTIISQIGGSDLSVEWNNERSGEHGINTWDPETGLRTEITYDRNDRLVYKAIIVDETGRLVYTEHYRYDDEDNIEYSMVCTDYVYDDEAGTYSCQFVYHNGGVGTMVCLIENGATLTSEWVNESTGESGSYIWDRETNLTTDITTSDFGRRVSKSVLSRATGAQVSTEEYEYDDEGNTVWFHITTDYVYHYEEDTFSFRYSNSDGITGTTVKRISDDAVLSDEWANESTGESCSSVFDYESGLVTEVNRNDAEGWMDTCTREIDTWRSIASEHKDFDSEGNVIRWETWSDFVYYDDENYYTCRRTTSEGQITDFTFRIDDGFTLSETWVNDDGSHGSTVWDTDAGLVTEIYYGKNNRWMDKYVRTYADWRLVSSEHYDYDDEGTVISSEICTDYVYNDEDGTFSCTFTNMDGRTGTYVTRVADGFRLSETWVNDDGSHSSTVWDTDAGLVTEIYYGENSRWMDKYVRTYADWRLVASEHYDYDDEGNVISSEICTDYVYNDENGTFSCTFTNMDGRTGTYVTRNEDEFRLSETWVNESDGSYGSTVWDTDAGLVTEIISSDVFHYTSKTIHDMETGRKVYSEHSEYDDEGNLLWTNIESNFVYNDEAGTYTYQLTDSSGSVATIVRRIDDDAPLSEDWVYSEDFTISIVWDYDTGLSTEIQQYDGGQLIEKYVSHIDNGQLVSYDQTEYDEEGTVIKSIICTGFVYDDEEGTFTFSFTHSNGRKGTVLALIDNEILLSKEWVNESTGESGSTTWDIDTGLATEIVFGDNKHWMDKRIVTYEDWRSVSFEHLDLDDEGNIIRWEKCTNYFYNDEEDFYSYSYTCSDGTVGIFVVRISDDATLSEEWSNESTGESGRIEYDYENGLMTEICRNDTEGWMDNCTRELDTWRSISSYHEEYDSEGNVRWERWSDFVYHDDENYYTCRRTTSDHVISDFVYRIDDGSTLSEEWVNEENGSHGSNVWDSDTGLITEIIYSNNDHLFSKRVRNMEDDHLVSAELYEYDDEGNVTWWIICTDYAYNDEEDTYTYAYTCDGMSGIRVYRITGNLILSDEWFNEYLDEQCSIIFDYDTGLATETIRNDQECSTKKNIYEISLWRMFSSEYNMYDSEGNVIRWETLSDFIYNDEEGTCTRTFRNSEGLTKTTTFRTDDSFLLAETWTNTELDESGTNVWDAESETYTCIIYTLSDDLIRSVTVSTADQITLKQYDYWYTDSAVHGYDLYSYSGTSSSMEHVVYSDDTLLSVTEYDNHALIRHSRFNQSGEVERSYDFATEPSLKIPQDTQMIEEEAFIHVQASIIYLPDNLNQIAANAFDEDAILVVNPESTTQYLLQAMDMTFVLSSY